MSAAEKLRALESQVVPGMAGDVRKLAYALPQIVAVVEAAELHVVTSAGHLHAIGLDVFDRALRDALAALDEALS